MADRKPLKVLPDSASGTGGGDSTGLGEFVNTDAVGVLNGGTGLNAVGNNQLLTGHSSSTTGALTSQSNLTFDGSTLQVTGALTVGVDDTGHDVKFFGATSNRYMLWDESGDLLNLRSDLSVFRGSNGTDRRFFVDESSGQASFNTDSGSIAPDGHVHIHSASAGSVTAHTNANDLVIEGGDYVGMSFLATNNANTLIAFGDEDDNDNGYIQYANDNNRMEFGVNGSERMRIDSSGAATMATNVSGAKCLTLNHDHMDNANYGLLVDFTGQAPDRKTEWFIRLDDTTANRGTWWSDGDIATSDGGSVNSDERLKTNIVDATDKLADVMKLKVRNFEWIPEYHPGKVGEKKIGFIAQELATVFPSLVGEMDIAPDNSIEEELYTADDEIPDGKEIGDIKVAAKAHEPTMRKTIKDAFAPILVKALQEVTVRLEAAEAKIAAMEAA